MGDNFYFENKYLGPSLGGCFTDNFTYNHFLILNTIGT